ncbi:MAG: NAD(P)/FAD-dependent oxidoreductase [Pseudomonas sp.]|nr:NAD(P)/FAD-dependent oxidoreductase [Pseudomonas sp.]
MDYKADYLVIGSGATAMAFVDTMLKETDSTFVMVDRRPKVGGHWNDAYPFSRLHQPSSTYGVASRALGRHKLDEKGFNKGYFELASGIEITHYYHSLMEEVFIPSKRVQYLPLCEYLDDGRIVSLMSGEEHKVMVTKKVVNATHITTEVPMTHTPKFKVEEGVRCVPPNHLCRLAPEFKHIAILGGGKTAIDSITWLLANDYPVDNITWVVPRDSWFYDRSEYQPDESFLHLTLELIARQVEVFSAASTVKELCLGMESAGHWLRLDKNVWPTMFHAAIISKSELKQIRRITNIVRLGRVEVIDSQGMHLTEGAVNCTGDTLYIDCTAAGLGYNVKNFTPVFTTEQINLQCIAVYQPCFSGAMIGYIEANIKDDTLRQAFTRPTPMTDTVEDYLRSQANYLMNQGQWRENPDLNKWRYNCRLDGFYHLIANITVDDDKKKRQLQRFGQHVKEAVENLLRLTAIS